MGQGLLSQSRISTFLSLWLGTALLYGGLSSEQSPLRLAGSAKFPWPQAFTWQQTQADDEIAAEDKIKSTIDTYFIVIHETLKTSELLDFGFLFDLNNVKAWNDYAYERGFIYIRIAADKENDTILTSYVYQPIFYSVNINGASADVKMKGYADWIVKGLGDRAGTTSPWSKHEFKLALINGQWKIERVHCPDSDHNIFPRDTDFEKRAEDVVRELRRLKKHDPLVIRKGAELRGPRRIE